MACVIPFPARRPAAKKTDYSFLNAYIHQWMAAEDATEEPNKPVLTSKTPEDEILKMLRRIDKRLAKMAAA